MALFHDSAIAGASGQAAGGAYKIERSLRFNSSDSAYLSRTPASAGNRKTWTWAGWVKRSRQSENEYVFSYTLEPPNDQAYIRLGPGITVAQLIGGNVLWILATSAAFRDPAGWFHLVVSLDTTQSTASDRVKIYVNGQKITAFSSATYPSLNYEGQINAALSHRIGTPARSAIEGFNGYLADIHFIDGQALDPTSFGEFDANNVWQPKAYTGTYGSQGWKLDFSDNSNNTATTLGKDSSPNGNNWTPNNLSVTAGAGNDSLVDTPTSYGTDTGAGGEVRGNYATLNPLQISASATLTEGNLRLSSTSSADTSCSATIVPASGKWYWEATWPNSFSPSSATYWGATGVAFASGTLNLSAITGVWVATDTGLGGTFSNGVRQTTKTTWANNDVIGIAFNADAMTLDVYVNNVKLGSTLSVPAGQYTPFALNSGSPCNCYLNFGQRPFAYTAPSGFKALCDTNLPAPVVAKPNTAFDVKLWTGTGSSQTISGFEFSPDLVWIKSRNNAGSNALLDTVRGASLVLRSDSTAAETNNTSVFTSFNSNGFTLGADTVNGWTNFSSWTYVGWSWDAGSSTVTNTQGSITSQVRANASAGFSIVTFTGGGAGSTIGHGLGVAPQLIIVKDRGVSSDWCVYHVSTGAGNFTKLNTTDASTANTTMWGNTTPTSTNFIWGFGSGNNYVAYCFAPVAGYSSFGSYTGNGSTDGPFVFCNFRPRWVLAKRTDSTGDWILTDSARNTFNVVNELLKPNLSDATETYSQVDFLSNGFKVRNTGTNMNASGGTYVYAAFAESPLQYARAR